MNCFSSTLAVSPLWTAASPSAPDTWATRGPRCRTRPRTRSLASAPRRPPRPAAPRRRRGSSCLQVSWVTRWASVIAQDRHNHETLTQELAHTLLHNWITYGHRVCLCIRAPLPQNYNSLEWQLKTTARFCVSGFLFFSCLTLTGCFYIRCSKCKIRWFHEGDLRASQTSSGPMFSRHKCEAFQYTNTENGLQSEGGDILCSAINIAKNDKKKHLHAHIFLKLSWGRRSLMLQVQFYFCTR